MKQICEREYKGYDSYNKKKARDRKEKGKRSLSKPWTQERKGKASKFTEVFINIKQVIIQTHRYPHSSLVLDINYFFKCVNKTLTTFNSEDTSTIPSIIDIFHPSTATAIPTNDLQEEHNYSLAYYVIHPSTSSKTVTAKFHFPMKAC